MASVVAITFSSQAEGTLMEASSVDALPSYLISWDYEGSTERDSRLGVIQGAALGCEDGTLYLFQSPSSERKQESLTSSQDLVSFSFETEQPSRSSSSARYSGLGLRPPRSMSPSSTKSSNLSPMQLTKSRIVSGVSPEQVEAPKNYVDFDDEPEKLKGMLKGKGIKEKSMADSLMSGVEKTLTSDKSRSSPSQPPSGKSSLRRRDDSKALLSATLSPASSTRSLSSPPSPRYPSNLQYPNEAGDSSLSMTCHIFPPNSGASPTVTDLKVCHRGQHLLCLHQEGNLEVYSTIDGSCIASAQTGDTPPRKLRRRVPTLWTWKSLHVASIGEPQIILACASPEVTSSGVQSHNGADGDNEEQTRIVAFELSQLDRVNLNDSPLKKIGDWTIDGSVEGLELYQKSDGQLEVLHITSSFHFVKHQLIIVETPHTPEADEPAKTNSNVHLPLPNPFKALTSRSTDHLLTEEPDEKEAVSGRIKLGEEVDMGAVLLERPVLAIRTTPTSSGLRGVVWSENNISGFECHENSQRNLFSRPLSGICDVKWDSPSSYVVLFRGRIERYILMEVDANNDIALTDASANGGYHAEPKLQFSTTLLPSDGSSITPKGHALTTRVKRGRRRLEYTAIDPSSAVTASVTLWKARHEDPQTQKSMPYISSLLPLELEHIILGYTDGLISRSSLSRLTREVSRGSSDPVSDVPLSGHIISLHLVQNTRTGDRLLIGGADDGSIAVWSLESLKLLARWTVFTMPLLQVISISEGHLKDCALCIAQDGTIAVITIDGLYLVPASVAPLSRVCLGEDNLLLYYVDGRARLWDIRTREFWRSMASDKANELVKAGGWSEWAVNSVSSRPQSVLSTLMGSTRSLDGAATLLIDVEAFLVQLGLNAVPPGTKATETASDGTLALKAENIKAILSVLLTVGLSEDIDRMCQHQLGIQPSSASVGFTSRNSTAIFSDLRSQLAWSISPQISATRASVIVALLQTLLQCEGTSDDADTVTAFYTAALGQIIGASYAAPDLPFLVRQCLESTAGAIRHASRLLFESGVARLSDEETNHLVDTWQVHLPSLQSESQIETIRCAMALFICGSIAVEKYALLPSGYLTDIAKSIALYLHDESSPYRALAVDLCSLGFPVWQQHVDAVQMLRALFTLATTTRKEAISLHNVGQQARTAVLHIASTNTPLFMTTLAIDILHPKNVQHRKSVMQLVIFLIRKKPLVLYSNLPRLVEAVVKSLDPNSTASRDAVLDTATEILGHVVQSFPTVDFHMATQRLAVGTSEGSVVMYDLKTATRLYVLEGHKKRTTACSFSPDGRRLVTLSLEERTVLVWKVGSSFTSFFNPGAPPRQGNNGSEPFKTLSFNIGEDANMSVGNTLELVKFEWTADRSVKLKIRDSVLTFST